MVVGICVILAVINMVTAYYYLFSEKYDRSAAYFGAACFLLLVAKL